MQEKLDHIQKQVLYGIGDETSPTVNPLNSTMAVVVQNIAGGVFQVRIRQDVSSAVAHSQFNVNSTPWDYNDDRFIVYEFNATTGVVSGIPAHTIQVRACPVTSVGAGCATPEVLTAQLVGLTNVTETNGGLFIENLILRYNPASAVPDERINPTISINQQFFYNYTQSLNY